MAKTGVMKTKNMFSIRVGDYIQVKPQLVISVTEEGVATRHNYFNFDDNQIEKVLPPMLKAGDKVTVEFMDSLATVKCVDGSEAWIVYDDADYGSAVEDVATLEKV